MCSGEIDLALRSKESTWYDGFVSVTHAYNDRISGVLETRSTTSAERSDKAVRLVSYARSAALAWLHQGRGAARQPSR
jgi:hypothetical protein